MSLWSALLNMLYKNIVATMPLVLFGFLSLYCGVMFVNPYTYTLYNVLYAAFPIGFFCVFDRECREIAALEARPAASYAKALAAGYISRADILHWILLAVYQALLLHALCWYVLGFGVDF